MTPSPNVQTTQSASCMPAAVQDYGLDNFDLGVFSFELLKSRVITKPRLPFRRHRLKLGYGAAPPDDAPESTEPKKDPRTEGVQRGTYQGTKMALNSMFNLIEQRYATYYDVTGLESVLPQPYDLADKQELYVWSREGPPGTDFLYPPHCSDVPPNMEMSQWQIFNKKELANTALLIPKLIPNHWWEKPIIGALDELRFSVLNDTPAGAKTMKDVYEHNLEDLKRLKAKTGGQVVTSDTDAPPLARNIGEREDWFSDAMFAQQSFTGSNPVTIAAISAVPKTENGDSLLKEFLNEARKAGRTDVVDFIVRAQQSEFYVQDHRDFRKATGVADDHIFKSNKNGDSPEQYRFAVAAVTLFHLGDAGHLHPIAIVIDYKKNMAQSVVKFNRNLKPSEDGSLLDGEAEDWEWRYAKTCAQVSDFIRHEMASHLTLTHFVEEALIVATQRSFEWDHMIVRILYPHWYKTLSLNKAARDTLVPSVVSDIVGFTPEECFNYINYSYENYDFTGSYVPNDLKNRGFPVEDLDSPKFHNYAYARNVNGLWEAIRAFVKSMLEIHYPSEKEFEADREALNNWCSEMRDDDKGRLKSFPETIESLEALTDVVTMCIHIASPQHTAVNYLQNYYQYFVVNKPAALYTEPPQTLEDLAKVNEAALMKALPIEYKRDWLLSSHLPYLLSFRVSEKNSLAGYAASLYHVSKAKAASEEKEAPEISECAGKFYITLVEFEKKQKQYSDDRDPWFRDFAYDVLHPDATAVSILI